MSSPQSNPGRTTLRMAPIERDRCTSSRVRRGAFVLLVAIVNACASSGGGSESNGVPDDCVTTCQKATAARCASVRPESDCETDCAYVTTTAPACRTENKAFIACAARSGCASEALAVLDCADRANDGGASSD